jgi:hypothetical protein
MSISEILLPELESEMQKTRATLERVPNQPDFVPHAKSMPLGKLAPHVAQLGGFGVAIMTLPELDFSTASYTPLAFESSAQLVKILDENASKVRAALMATSDEGWTQNWKLSFSGKVLFEGSRFLAYRQMFLNHIIHHRAQLGVYLRLAGVPVPRTYGPSADEPI